MQVKGVFGNFFKKNIQNLNPKKIDTKSEAKAGLQSVKIQDDLKQSSEARQKLEKIKESMKNNVHSFNSERANTVLNGADTGRLDKMRNKVLAETMKQENKKALVNPKTWEYLKNLRGE